MVWQLQPTTSQLPRAVVAVVMVAVVPQVQALLDKHSLTEVRSI